MFRVMLCCVLCVVGLCVITFSCLVMCSLLVHFSFIASLSFCVWPAEVHRITGAGRPSPVRQMELIIGIRDGHKKSFCVDFENDAEVVDSEQDHLQHGAGFRSTLLWRDTARRVAAEAKTAGVCPW